MYAVSYDGLSQAKAHLFRFARLTPSYLPVIIMKIARIETFILGTQSSKDLLFCRVETEDGFYGWGEGYVTAGKETVIAECVKAMTPHVIGRGVFNIRHTGQIMFEDFAIRRISLELMAAWSAIEIAS
ncbi:MAG: hypothetical protein JO008_01530, partial [Alphaproteobacteria bacterium]|nr:hypothetical protein [Alphaproteobacteria bacterium]